MPAGCAPGRYKLGEQEVDLTADNRVVLAGQTRLAGSALRMDRGIKNLMRLGGLTLANAVRMATLNPARAARIAGRHAGLEAGERGDVVSLRYIPESCRIYIDGTWLNGKQVYSATMAPD